MSASSVSSVVTSDDGMGSLGDLIDVDAMSDTSVPLHILDEVDVEILSDSDCENID